jgi:hypothetical protein
VLLNIAALTGQLRTSIALASKVTPPSVIGVNVPQNVLRDALTLNIYAAFGGADDSVRKVGSRVEEKIRSSVSPERRRDVRQGLLSRPVMLAFPGYRALSLDSIDRAADDLLVAQAAFLLGDRALVRSRLDRLSRSRIAFRPADITLDALIPEAWLLASIGDIPAAIERLDPTLKAVSSLGPGNLEVFTRAASLGRAMRLRAELARCAGDGASARRWEAAAAALLSDAKTSADAPSAGKQRRMEGCVFAA